MGKGAPKAPAAPDPAQLTAAQAAANKDAAIAQANINMVNQVTPYGSLSYTQRGTASDGTPQYTATTTLSPAQQQMLDYENQTGIKTAGLASEYADRIRDATSPAFSLDRFGAAPAYDENARVAARERLVARQAPQFERDREALETRLLNQGVTLGSEAYSRGVDEFNRARNDFYLAADQQAGAEAGQEYGRAVDMRNRAISEALMARSQPINEVAALTGVSGGVQQPTFVNAPQQQVQAADPMGANQLAYQGQLAAFNAKNANYQANLQGLYGLGRAAVGATILSDVRLKRDVRRVGTRPDGLPLYQFRYLDGEHVYTGVLAQDVAAVRPDAVSTWNGWLTVDYRALGEFPSPDAGVSVAELGGVS